jgi:hypothetical protein
MERWYVPFVAGVVIALAALYLEREFKGACCAKCAGQAADGEREPL